MYIVNGAKYKMLIVIKRSEVDTLELSDAFLTNFTELTGMDFYDFMEDPYSQSFQDDDRYMDIEVPENEASVHINTNFSMEYNASLALIKDDEEDDDDYDYDIEDDFEEE